MIPKLTKAAIEENGLLVEAVVQALQRKPDAIGVVLFQNKMFDSTQFGKTVALVVGPSNTFKTVEACEGVHLNDGPSTRQYPLAWVPREEILP